MGCFGLTITWGACFTVDAGSTTHSPTSNAANNEYHLGGVMEMQAVIWYRQHRLEQAKSEALRAADIFEKLGSVRDVERCREHLQVMEELNNASG